MTGIARSSSLQPPEVAVNSRATDQRSKRFTSLPPELTYQCSLSPRGQTAAPAPLHLETLESGSNMSDITSSTHMGGKRITRSQSRGTTPVARATPARGLRGRSSTPGGGLRPVARESKAYGTGPATLARPLLSGEGEDDVAAIMHGIAFGEQTPGSGEYFGINLFTIG